MIVELRMVAMFEDHDEFGKFDPGAYAVRLMAFPVPNNPNSKGVTMSTTEAVFKTEEEAQAYIDREAKEAGPWSVEWYESRIKARNGG